MDYLTRLKVAIKSTSGQIDEIEVELARLDRSYWAQKTAKSFSQECIYVRRIGAERERLEMLLNLAQGRLSRLHRQLIAVQTGREESGVPHFDGDLGKGRRLSRSHAERLRHR